MADDLAKARERREIQQFELAIRVSCPGMGTVTAKAAAEAAYTIHKGLTAAKGGRNGQESQEG